MPDPRFFDAHGPFTLAELRDIADAESYPPGDGDRLFHDIAPLDAAGPDQVSFFVGGKYAAAFRKSRAGACVLSGADAGGAPEGMGLLIVARVDLAFARIAAAFHPEPPVRPATAPSAVVDPSAEIGSDSRIEANAVVEAGVIIGGRCLVGPSSVVGRNVVIGDDVRIGANVTLGYCVIGSRVRLASGVRIGEAGFGLAITPGGAVGIPQLGRVVIEDDVEIGANTAIDRGSAADTVIGRGSRIDNLVQIGHNVRLGEGCIVVGQAGIGGSSTVGKGVVLAGQAGIAGHLKIGDGARIGGQAGVIGDVGPGESVVGFPAVPVRSYFRGVSILKRITEKKSLKRLTDKKRR